MADNSPKQEFLQILKRFGTYLSLKMSNLLHFSLLNLDSKSVGAVAGLALAILFSWKLLKSPARNQTRRPRPSGLGVNTRSNSNLTSSEDVRIENVKDEIFQNVKPTVGQVVRQKLSDGRKVTCTLLGVIFEETTPEELQKQATMRSSVLEVLLEITKHTDLYFMERVLDDESEKKALQALEDAGFFTFSGMAKDKVLFCSTENGRASFVRQLEPDWHIDTSPEIVFQLSRFIKHELLITPTKLDQMVPNVFSSESLEQFFDAPEVNKNQII